MRADVVLPVPRGPENRYAWPSRPLGDGVAQGPDDVVLALDLAEPSGPVAAVQRLGGHRGQIPSGCDSDGGAAPP